MGFSSADLALTIDTIRATRNGYLAVNWLISYEWLATLPEEVELIYPSRWNSIKAAYLLCRYYPLLVWPLIVFGYVANHSAQTCAKWTHIISAAQLPMQILAPGVMLMRAYAFTGRSVRVLVFLLSFYTALVGIAVWFFCFSIVPLSSITFEDLGGTGCFPDYTRHGGTGRLVLTIGASAGMDLISLLFIAIYCVRARSARGSLGRTLIHQGVGAFAVVLIIHGGALGLYLSPPHGGFGIPYILVVPNLIACRLILNLRRKARPTETEIRRQNSILVEKAFESPDLWVIDQDPQLPSDRQCERQHAGHS
ncbi:hypothetical protein B0H16DRAFT_955814 [Mycena metata]|uniref:DUF6533 domain-containing protein n=1 Tax=Mycena metata TaxID=1033252 RepID=A0AAD7NVZ6_9AGAR|nr:hypothetical protein B0H16DRAFT_955814 [Mycena metata]